MASDNSTKKLPSELSEEELLKSLDSDEVIIPQAANNVVAFLLFYNIEPGAFPVRANVLYKLYTKHTKDPVPPGVFSREVGNYIKNVASYFHINKCSFKIADKTFQLLQSRTKTKTTLTFKRHYENFIKGCDFQTGGFWTCSNAFYETYKTWCKKVGRRNPIAINSFNKLCKVYFSEKIVKNKKYYGINRKLENAEKEEKSKEKK